MSNVGMLCIAFAAMTLFGCGSGGGGPTTTTNPPQGTVTNFPPSVDEASMSIKVGNIYTYPNFDTITRKDSPGVTTIKINSGASDINDNLKSATCKIYSPQNTVIDGCTTKQFQSPLGFNSLYAIIGFEIYFDLHTDLNAMAGQYKIETIVTDLNGLSASTFNYFTLN